MTANQEKRVNRLLVRAGYEETEVDKLSKCVRSGLIRGYYGFKFTGDPNQLDSVVLEAKCIQFSEDGCKGTLKATVRDLLQQPDYAGTDYEEGCSEATVNCDLCDQGQYVTGCCTKKPDWDNGKSHNHCTKCPGLGKCIGDYRMSHCRHCGSHYFGGIMTSYPCPKCGGRSDSEDDEEDDDDDDEDEGQPRKRMRMNGFF